MKTALIHFRSINWTETTVFDRADGGKVVRVEAESSYDGELAGTTKVGYIMHYFSDQTGSYDGWEQFEGNFGGKPGTVLLRHEGTFDLKGVSLQVSTVEGSGTGSLQNQKLSFSARLEGHGPYDISLEIG